MSNTLDLQDWHVIAKAFEKGANASITSESVFAVLTPQLSTARCVTATVSNQMAAFENTSTQLPGGAEQPGASLGMGPKDPSLAAVSADNGKDVFGGFFASKCFPCDFRVLFKGELGLKMGVKFPNYLEMLQDMLDKIKNDIFSVLNMFNDTSGYIDLCALLKFLTKGICIPDLFRIIAALMAYLMNLSISLNSAIDFLISLVAPLFMPFFTNIIDLLQQFILLAIQPLECIVNNLEQLLSKLDYNVLFQNIDNIQNVNLGPKSGMGPGDLANRASTLGSALGDRFNAVASVPVNATGNFNPVANFPRQETLFDTKKDPGVRPVNFNPTDVLVNPLTGLNVKQTNAQNQQDVNDAAKQLDLLNQASQSVDPTDPAAVARAQDQVAKANSTYQNARTKADSSLPERASKKIEQFRTSMKSSLLSLVGYLRNVAALFDSMIAAIFDEFKKLIGDYFGGGADFIFSLKDKLAVIQMIGFVKGIIHALGTIGHCDEGKEIESYMSSIPIDQGLTILQNADGSVQIKQADSIVDAPLQNLLGSIGAFPGANAGGAGSNTPLTNGQGRGVALNNITGQPVADLNAGGSVRDRFKSLIPLTGNLTLDTQISKAVEALTNPVKVTFRCPLQTSVSQGEQVNRWISELDAQ